MERVRFTFMPQRGADELTKQELDALARGMQPYFEPDAESEVEAHIHVGLARWHDFADVAAVSTLLVLDFPDDHPVWPSRIAFTSYLTMCENWDAIRSELELCGQRLMLLWDDES